jgi:class 3 adenylate cyclase
MALFPTTAADAIIIQRDLQQYNEARLAKGAPAIRLGIGIHTGRLMLGTVGEAKRMDTTVIGDAVNTAARMEQFTKQYAADVIISGDVYQLVGREGGGDYRFLGRDQAKGREQLVDVYAVVGGA